MQVFHNILVGVDLAHGDNIVPPFQQAVRYALWLARETSAALTFLSVLHGRGSAAMTEAGKVLAALVRQAETGGVRAQARTVEGAATVEIIQQVRRDHHDLVLIGPPSAKGLRYTLFGSTATHLLYESPCPVWIARAEANPTLRNLLVASDLTSVSQDALCAGLQLARSVKAKAHILHVVDYPLDHHWATGNLDPATAKYHREVRATAEKALREQIRQTVDEDGVDIQIHVIGKAGVLEVDILDFLATHQIDLLLLGGHPHKGLEAALIGNTAERLLPELPCSVLVVKPGAGCRPMGLN
jgi:universal stress protein E